jgi:hypothetical protein
MRLVQSQPLIAYNYLNQYKFPAINECSGKIYAETSHLACKGFLEPMIRMGLRPSLIILRRPPREVAWSFFERNTIPTRTTPGVQDMLDPRDLGVVPLLGWDMLSNYQLCYWYALEIERRQLFYADMGQQLGMKIVDITNRELNDWNYYTAMLTRLGLQVADTSQEAHAKLSTESHNPNVRRLEYPDNINEEEESVWVSVSHFQPLLRDHILKRYSLE